MEHRVPYKHMLCPYSHPRPLGWGPRVKTFFLKIVMLHIELKGIEQRAPCKHIFCPYTHPLPLGWGQKVKQFKKSHVAYQIKGNGAESTMQANVLNLTHTMGPWSDQKNSSTFCWACVRSSIRFLLFQRLIC